MFIKLLLLLQLQTPVLVNKPLPGKKTLRDTTKNFIVLHYDDGNSYSIARRTLIRRRLSYHYYIQRDGKVIKLLDPKYEASHAGLSYYDGYVRLNKYSIGICFQNNSTQSFTEQQYKSAGWLVNSLQKRFIDTTSKIILGHGDIAVPRGRKKDPGQLFNWDKLKSEITEYESHNWEVSKT